MFEITYLNIGKYFLNSSFNLLFLTTPLAHNLYSKPKLYIIIWICAYFDTKKYINKKSLSNKINFLPHVMQFDTLLKSIRMKY